MDRSSILVKDYTSLRESILVCCVARQTTADVTQFPTEPELAVRRANFPETVKVLPVLPSLLI